MKKRTRTITKLNDGQVLFFDLLLGALLLLSIKFTLAGIIAIVLMPIFCKLYTNDSLFVEFSPINYLTTIIFVLSFFPGTCILLIIDFIKFLIGRN